MKDYIKIIEKESALNFKYIKYETFKDILNAFEKNEIDFIPGATRNKQYEEMGLLSKEYEKFNFSIVTNKDGVFIKNLEELKGKTLAIPEFFASYIYIKKHYPNIEIIKVKTIKEALTLVSKNKAYAFVGHQAISAFYIKNYFPNLKIVGLTKETYNHHFLISKDKKELHSIINKIIDSLSYEHKQKIREKWIKNKINLAVDYSIIYQIIFVFLIILLIIFYFIQKIRLAKAKIQEQKENFEKLFNEASDGLLLMKDSKFIECNDSSLQLLKYNKKEDFLNLKADEISPILQPDGEKSSLKAKRNKILCDKNGSANFEWVHIKSTGEHCWLDITLTKILLNNEDITHVVWRDITNKKLLEAQIKNRNKELEDSNFELETTIKNLKQTQDQLIACWKKMASLGGLVAGVAHEINTPVGIGLTGITHLEELTIEIKKSYKNETMSQEDFDEYLVTSLDLNKLINSNLNKAANLVKSFKQVAVDQSSEEKRLFNLFNYMKEILLSIHSFTKKTNIKIQYDCEKDIKINSYPGSFSQIITNLIMNSLIHGFKNKQEGKYKYFNKKR